MVFVVFGEFEIFVKFGFNFMNGVVYFYDKEQFEDFFYIVLMIGQCKKVKVSGISIDFSEYFVGIYYIVYFE